MAAPEPVDLSFVTTDVWGGSVLQWADQFTDVKDLVDKAIAKLKPGECIRRLVIAGHGADHTDGFFVFDPDTSGAQLIDGGTKKEPISPSVVTQLQRLKPYLCKDAIIEFRVCRFGEGKNGEAAMQAVADAVGVAVTAPMGSISSLAAIGGLATDWRVAYPKIWGLPTSTSFWRGEPTLPPPGAPSPTSIAPITGQVVPLRSVTTPPTPGQVLPPVRRLSIAEREDRREARRKRRFGAGAVAGGGLALFGVWLLMNTTPDGPGIGVASPSVPPTATPVAATPTVAPTASPTAAPTASPTPQPTPTLITIILPPNGTYFGSGMFRSYDGQESYQTSWRVIKTTGTVEIAQLLSPGGSPYQVLEGIVDPSGLFVAVSDDPNYCEVIVLESDAGPLLANDMFVAYGPSSMTCPGARELADFYLTLILGPEEHEADFRSQYSWGNDVVIGSVLTDGWTAD